jgi:peptidylprolyl isomerase
MLRLVVALTVCAAAAGCVTESSPPAAVAAAQNVAPTPTPPADELEALQAKRVAVAAPAAIPVPAASAITMASGLRIIDSKVGTGASPKSGQTLVMHYTGWLYENGQKGKKFDSSVDRNQPFEFRRGQVIKGWDEGVASMKVGGKRTLIIPPALGYGASGAGGLIPPNATLMFDVELLAVR